LRGPGSEIVVEGRTKEFVVLKKRRTPIVDLDHMNADDGPSPGAFYCWVLLVGWPVHDVLTGQSRPAWLATLALVTCAVLYIASIRTTFDGRLRWRVPLVVLGAFTAVVTAATLGFHGGWYSLWPLLGIAYGVALGQRVTRQDEFYLVLTVLGLPSLGVLVGWIGGASGGGIFGTWYGTATSCVVTAIILRQFAVIRALRETREELARNAVTEERLRFARDLHDLLGHTLSLMVVKAQAVRRLAQRDPAVAAEQAGDIEDVGRRALREVREAVTGYRGRGLTAEIDGARTALADAGIDVVIRQEGPPLPPEPDALLGWVVREGTTNVIRHSRARHAEIDVRHRAGQVVAEIRDDGAGGDSGDGVDGDPGDGEVAAGHGLSGLRERLAAAGGTLEAGPRRGGGFRLAVTLAVAGVAPEPTVGRMGESSDAAGATGESANAAGAVGTGEPSDAGGAVGTGEPSDAARAAETRR
jgi:two-component system sensor histidine kinase DesK